MPFITHLLMSTTDTISSRMSGVDAVQDGADG